MGNYLISPFQKNNDKNTHNENQRTTIIKKSFPSKFNENINKNLNDLTNFGESNKYLNRNKLLKTTSNTYYHGYNYKKNKNKKTNKLLFQDTKEGIIMNNIRRMSEIIFNKNDNNEEKDDNQNHKVEKEGNKSTNYIKKYKNNDKYYHYGKKKKKEKKLIRTMNIKLNDKENIDNNNAKKKKNKFRKERNKSEQNEKSSQFMLLNNYNTFNTLKEINKEKNNSNNKYQIKEDITFSSISNNNQKIIDNDKDEDKKENENIYKNNDNMDVDEDSNIKINKIKEFEQKFENNDYTLNEEKKDESEKNINFKETKDISEDINLESNLIDSSIYSFNGSKINDKKEGIGKFVFKNKIGLMSIFENDKILGPIIITDNNGNSFQGYLDENNNLDGYFNLKFNFNKDILKKKYKYGNNIITNKDSNESKKKEEIVVLSNFISLINIYLELSNTKYNYSQIESIISKNSINDYGIIKWRNKSKYIGEIKNNRKHGIGLFIWPDDSRYEGEFFEDKMEGWGLIQFFDGKIFQGQILNGVPHGYGEFIWNNNNRYVGNYVKGQKEGFGIYIMNIEKNNKTKNDLVTYFGFWKNGKQEGYGIVIKNKKINYVKYKEGKKMRQYDYDIFLGKISKVINKKHEKIFFSDLKTLKNIIKYIMKF